MRIVLPWPPKALSPNARVHWAVLAKVKKAYRLACWAQAREQGAKRLESAKLALQVTFYPPDRRARDDDNAIAAFKSGRDGLADALGIDDKLFNCTYVMSDEVRGTVEIKYESV